MICVWESFILKLLSCSETPCCSLHCYNSESWYNLDRKDIEKLESTDENLIRKIFSAHSKTPKELLYLESGCIPIRFILISRRLNFLWYMLNQNDDTMLLEFLRAQCENPVKGDWVLTVQKDLDELEIIESFDDIRETTKDAFKKYVKTKVKEKAFKYLKDLQNSHSKSQNIQYKEVKLQEYLKPASSMTIKEKSFIFMARSRMLDVKCNFKIGKSDLLCRKCGIENESQKHILSCKALQDNSLINSDYSPSYEDIFGSNIDKIELIGQILMEKFKHLTSDNPLCTVNLNNVTGAAIVAQTMDMD